MLAKRLGIDLGTANSLVWLAPAPFITVPFGTWQARLAINYLFPPEADRQPIGIRVQVRGCIRLLNS